MSAESIKQVVSRAVADHAFRALLFHDPAQALAGYELSETETVALSGLTSDSFDRSAADLEARLSHSLGGGPAIKGTF